MKSLLLLKVLFKHIKTVHEKQKDLKCEFCDKSFGQKGQLNVHIKTVHEKLNSYLKSKKHIDTVVILFTSDSFYIDTQMCVQYAL